MSANTQTAETSKSYRESFQEAESQCANMVNRYREQMSEAVESAPATAVLTAFGVGMGIGLLAALAISRPTHHRETAENLGRRILDSIAAAVPDSVSSRLHI